MEYSVVVINIENGIVLTKQYTQNPKENLAALKARIKAESEQQIKCNVDEILAYPCEKPAFRVVYPK